MVVSAWQSALLAALLSLGLAAWRLTRRYDRVPSTIDGARESLAMMAESAKWMSGIETATLAAGTWIMTESGSASLKGLSDWQANFAVLGVVFTGAGLFCCAWVLTAVASVMSRMHGHAAERVSAKFDIHEERMFSAPSPRLGNMMALQHWLWAAGLVCLGILLIMKVAARA